MLTLKGAITPNFFDPFPNHGPDCGCDISTLYGEYIPPPQCNAASGDSSLYAGDPCADQFEPRWQWHASGSTVSPPACFAEAELTEAEINSAIYAADAIAPHMLKHATLYANISTADIDKSKVTSSEDEDKALPTRSEILTSIHGYRHKPVDYLRLCQHVKVFINIMQPVNAMEPEDLMVSYVMKDSGETRWIPFVHLPLKRVGHILGFYQSRNSNESKDLSTRWRNVTKKILPGISVKHLNAYCLERLKRCDAQGLASCTCRSSTQENQVWL